MLLKFASFRDGLDMENTPVQVVAHSDVYGWGVAWFTNMAEAKAQFPTLDPYHNTKDFTWSMKGMTPDGRVALRFETWPANNILSV